MYEDTHGLYTLISRANKDVRPTERHMLALMGADNNTLLVGYCSLAQPIAMGKFVVFEYPALIQGFQNGQAVVQNYRGCGKKLIVNILDWGVGLGLLEDTLTHPYHQWLRNAYPELFAAEEPPEPPPALKPVFDSQDAS